MTSIATPWSEFNANGQRLYGVTMSFCRSSDDPLGLMASGLVETLWNRVITPSILSKWQYLTCALFSLIDLKFQTSSILKATKWTTSWNTGHWTRWRASSLPVSFSLIFRSNSYPKEFWKKETEYSVFRETLKIWPSRIINTYGERTKA